jgi:hypothetical protein
MSPKECNPESDSDQIKRGLRDDVRTAEAAYRQAAAQSRSIADRLGDLPLGHPDGAEARHLAARTEAAALEKYRSAVKAFSDWVLHAKSPAP